jgi:hypothetical protein
MSDDNSIRRTVAPTPGMAPAQPLWRLAPTRDGDGRSLADFMMLIPGLAARPGICRESVTASIREVCESYGDRVAFADVNFAINVLWVSVLAEPGLSGRVARSIRERVPDALLVGGQLATGGDLRAADPIRRRGWQRLKGLSRRAVLMLRGPGP